MRLMQPMISRTTQQTSIEATRASSAYSKPARSTEPRIEHVSPDRASATDASARREPPFRVSEGGSVRGPPARTAQRALSCRRTAPAGRRCIDSRRAFRPRSSRAPLERQSCSDGPGRVVISRDGRMEEPGKHERTARGPPTRVPSVSRRTLAFDQHVGGTPRRDIRTTSGRGAGGQHPRRDESLTRYGNHDGGGQRSKVRCDDARHQRVAAASAENGNSERAGA